jgi:MFS family permease
MLVALILASSLIFLSGSVVNVALPAIGRSFEAGLTALQWIVDGYVLTLASLMLLSGSLGDRYGRQRVMLVGLLGFGATALACGLAPSVTWLIGTRLLQGIAGALVVPGSLAILRDVYTDPEARGQAMAAAGGVVAALMVEDE